MIKFVSSEADSICSQLKNAKSKGNDAIGNVSKARSIDATISSRMNISADLSYLSRNVSRELSRLDTLAERVKLAANDFEDADHSICVKSKKLLAHIRKAKTEALWESINGTWVERIGRFLKKHGVLLGILGPVSAATSSSVLIGGASVAILSAWITSRDDPEHKDSGNETNAKNSPNQNNGSQRASNAGEPAHFVNTDQEMQEQINRLLHDNEFLGSNWPAGEMREITKQMYTSFISKVSKAMGITIYGNFSFSNPSGYAGWFSPEYPSTIFVNNLLVAGYSDYDSYEMNLRIIVHEMRHAYQNAAIQNPGKYLVEQTTLDQWSYEMENYVDITDSFQGYTEQFCEKDARFFTSEVFKDF